MRGQERMNRRDALRALAFGTAVLVLKSSGVRAEFSPVTETELKRRIIFLMTLVNQNGDPIGGHETLPTVMQPVPENLGNGYWDLGGGVMRADGNNAKVEIYKKETVAGKEKLTRVGYSWSGMERDPGAVQVQMQVPWIQGESRLQTVTRFFGNGEVVCHIVRYGIEEENITLSQSMVEIPQEGDSLARDLTIAGVLFQGKIVVNEFKKVPKK